MREARKVQRGEDSPFGERTPTAAELGLTSDKAADLAVLEQIALQANPAIRKAVNGVNMAYLAIKIKKADFLPMISASVGHSRTTHNTNKHNYDYDTVGTYNVTWREALELPGAKQLAIAKKLLEDLPTMLREPADNFLNAQEKPILPAVACRDEAGLWALIYLPESQTVDINLNILSKLPAEAVFINPRTGQITATEQLAASTASF